MRRILRRLWQDERGVSLAIIALTMTTLLSLLAFSLDLGSLYTARAEAQRAADAAALAGASAFLNFPESMQEAAAAEAESRARRYASLNTIRGRQPSKTTSEADATGGRSITVTVRQDTIRLWFAQLLGVSNSAVEASATAGAVPARTANCVAPFSFDATDVAWGDQTSYGDPVTIAPASEDPAPPTSNPHHEFVTLDFFQSWQDGRFRECSSPSISIYGEPVPTAGYQIDNLWALELMDDHRQEWWNPGTQRVENESGEPVWDSPRIITVMLHQPLAEGSDPIASDFMLFFVEHAQPGENVVQGRFLAYASGTDRDDRSQTMFAVQLTR